MNERTSNPDIQSQELRIFEAVPGNNLLIKADSPRYTIVDASEGYLTMVDRPKAELTGKGVFEAFPPNPNRPQDSIFLKASFEEAIVTKKVSKLPVQRYDVQDEEDFTSRYWRIVNSPVLDHQGNVSYIINTVEDITNAIKAEHQEEKIKALRQAHNLLLQAPMAIQIFKGPDLIVELANDLTLKMWGRDESAIGRPFLEVLPELKGEGYELMMAEVMKTGIAKTFYEIPIYLNKAGKKELGYYNFVYQPYYEEDKTKAAGVLVFSNEVTEQVINREKIKESEQRLDMAIEIAELGVFNIDLLSGRAIFNRQIMDWFGFKEENIPMAEMLSKVYSEDIEMVTRELRLTFVKESGGRHNIIYRVVQPDTNSLQYLNSIGQVQFEGNMAVSIKGVMQNVTKQVLSNQKLKESEQKLRSIIMNSSLPIVVLLGKELLIEIANQKALDNWGKGNIVGKTLKKAVPETVKQGIYEKLIAVYETGIPYHVKHQKLHFIHDGKERVFYYNYSIIPLFDENKKIYGLISTGEDVTDLIIAKQTVEESSQNLQNLVMQSPVGMCILKGPNHIIEIVNDSQLELWGRDRSSVLNKPVLEALPEGKSQGVEEILNKVYTTGEIYRAYELPVKMFRNGQMESFYVNVEHRPFRESNGRIGGIMSVSHEITDLVLARQKIEDVVAKRTRELAEVNYALQQNNMELEQFAYVAAHDLQEPLRTISNFVGLFVKKYGHINPDAETYTRFILNATQRLQHLIRDLLDYSTIRSDIPFTTVNLNGVLKAVLNEMNPLIGETNASIISDELPVVTGNKIELKRVFQHLISNAIKFRKLHIPPEIQITAKATDNEYYLAIRDNGIGMEKQYLDKLFIIFQRLHNTGEYEGTGIGLAICKKIVALHGGRIWVDSEPGVGTTFYFTFPKAPPS